MSILNSSQLLKQAMEQQNIPLDLVGTIRCKNKESLDYVFANGLNFKLVSLHTRYIWTNFNAISAYVQAGCTLNMADMSFAVKCADTNILSAVLPLFPKNLFVGTTYSLDEKEILSKNDGDDIHRLVNLCEVVIEILKNDHIDKLQILDIIFKHFDCKISDMKSFVRESISCCFNVSDHAIARDFINMLFHNFDDVAHEYIAESIFAMYYNLDFYQYAYEKNTMKKWSEDLLVSTIEMLSLKPSPLLIAESLLPKSTRLIRYLANNGFDYKNYFLKIEPLYRSYRLNLEMMKCLFELGVDFDKRVGSNLYLRHHDLELDDKISWFAENVGKSNINAMIRYKSVLIEYGTSISNDIFSKLNTEFYKDDPIVIGSYGSDVESD
jgi:hypothetical protein